MQKLLLISILIIMALFLLPITAVAVEIIMLPDGSAMPTESIRVARDPFTGELVDIAYYISDTGATSGIRYRTAEITFNIGGMTGVLPASALVAHHPEPGKTVYSLVTITVNDIYTIVGANDPATKAKVDAALADPMKIQIGATIEIYNAATGTVLDTIHSKDQLKQIADKYSFSAQNIENMQSRFLGNPQPSGINLAVKITKASSKTREGSTAGATARVTNQSGQIVKTTLLWRVDGVIVHETNDFIVSTTRDTSIAFNMPNKNALVEVIVNPDNANPVEAYTKDNQDSVIVMLDKPGQSAKGEFYITIDTPEYIPAQRLRDRKPFEYVVNVHWDWYQTWTTHTSCSTDTNGNESCSDYDVLDTPPTKNVQLEVDASGLYLYETDGDIFSMRPKHSALTEITDVHKDNFSITAKGGAKGTVNTQTIPKAFLFPDSFGMYGMVIEPTKVIIKATTIIDGKKVEAEKEVIIGRLIHDQLGVGLVQ